MRISSIGAYNTHTSFRGISKEAQKVLDSGNYQTKAAKVTIRRFEELGYPITEMSKDKLAIIAKSPSVHMVLDKSWPLDNNRLKFVDTAGQEFMDFLDEAILGGGCVVFDDEALDKALEIAKELDGCAQNPDVARVNAQQAQQSYDIQNQ